MNLKQIARNAIFTFTTGLSISLLSLYIAWFFNDAMGEVGTISLRSVTGLLIIAFWGSLVNLVMYSKKPLSHKQTVLRHYIIVLLVIPVPLLVAYYVGWFNHFYNHFLLALVILIFTLFGIVGAFFSVYLFLNKELKSELISQEKNFYYSQCKLMQESVRQVKSLRHDIKLHLHALQGMAEKSNSDEITGYLSELLKEIDKSEVHAQTGNIAFDSIINFKLNQEAAAKVNLDVQLSIPPNLNMAAIDVVTIVGNLLDNALTALTEVAEAEDKILKLKIKFDKGSLFIQVENTFDGVVKYSSKKTILSRKEVRFAEHGWGLENVTRSVKKYNGHVDINHCESIFSVALILYLDS